MRCMRGVSAAGHGVAPRCGALRRRRAAEWAGAFAFGLRLFTLVTITYYFTLLSYPNFFSQEHWTLWSVDELSHREICDWIEDHIDKSRPDVVSWNYDDNN